MDRQDKRDLSFITKTIRVALIVMAFIALHDIMYDRARNECRHDIMVENRLVLMKLRDVEQLFQQHLIEEHGHEPPAPQLFQHGSD